MFRCRRSTSDIADKAASGCARGNPLLFALLTCALALSTAASRAGDAVDPVLSQAARSSLLRIVAQKRGGQEDAGSAILIDADTVVTNCHVTHGARHIEATLGQQRWRARPHVSDIEHDICVLKIEQAANPSITLASSAELEVGQTVYAAGYEHDQQLQVRRGEILALYPYAGGFVIRTNAAFNPGQSGGALLDAAGRVVGVLAFKSAQGGAFHFALPAEWVQQAASRESNSAQRAFWQRPGKDQPAFLRAAALEDARDWEQLLTLSRRWSENESDNAEAWLARAKAAQHNNRAPTEAAAALRAAAKLNPRHRLARQQVLSLERDLVCARYTWCGTSERVQRQAQSEYSR